MNLGAHPVAELMPMLRDSELQELAESIGTNGLLRPIVLDQQGLILDLCQPPCSEISTLDRSQTGRRDVLGV